MGVRSWRLVLFSLCVFFTLGLCKAKTLREGENKEVSSYEYEFSTKLDSVPIVNPTTPGTANPYPTFNPTTPQAPDTTGQTPSTPKTSSPPTTPYMTPTNPSTNPTTPTTTPPNPTATTTPTTPTTPTTSSGGQWCVASQSAAENTLKVALDYACGYGADCSAIQPGATCYNPNTLKDHASYAFNDYYQKNPAPTSCAFGGTATLTNKDPSNGNCHYTSSKTPSMSPPTYVSPPNPPSPPSTMTPPAPSTMTPTTPSIMTPTAPNIMTPTTPGMTIPGGASVYGPTGSPNIGTSASHSVLLLFTLCAMWISLHAQNYI